MDVLSEVLRVVKLDGALFFNAEFSAPWCVSEPDSPVIASRLSPEASHLILYHFVTEGSAYAKLPDGTKVELGPGDIVVFPHGDAHFLGNGRAIRPVDAMSTFAPNLTAGVKVAKHGGGGQLTKFVCGYMTCDPELGDVFLSGLPKMLKVHVDNEPSGKWLENSIRFSVAEDTGLGDGTGLVLTKLSELLFVETLRRYINTLPSEQTGWLAGARDPMIGKALALLHSESSEPWTVESLARRIGLSRARFAERFRYFLDESPIAYLNRWRLKLGAEQLQSTDHSVAEIAAAVGYGSEATFNRAFKREFKCPPAQYRRKHKEKPSADSTDYADKSLASKVES